MQLMIQWYCRKMSRVETSLKEYPMNILLCDQQKRNTELAEVKRNLRMRNGEHPVMVSAQRRARAPSIVNASALLANAPNDRQRYFHNSAQTHSLGARTRHLMNENRLPEEFDYGNKGSRCNIKPATFDGSNSWLDYKSHFDACATINNWSEKEKGLYLAVSLRGTAQGVLGNVSKETGQHYDLLVKALEEKFAPPNQTELYRAQFKERKQRASETLFVD